MTDPPASSPTVITRLRAAGCVFAEEEARLLGRGRHDAGPPRRPGAAAGFRPAARARPGLGGVLRTPDRSGHRSLRAPPPHRVPGPGGRAAPAAPPAAPDGRRWSSTCAAAQGRWGPRSRRWPVPWSFTPPTSTRPRCSARPATSCRCGGEVHDGDLYEPLPERLRGRVESSPSTPRMFPRPKSAPCRRKPACTSRGFPSTAVQTGFRSSGGWPPGRRNGWPRAATC